MPDFNEIMELLTKAEERNKAQSDLVSDWMEYAAYYRAKSDGRLVWAFLWCMVFLLTLGIFTAT